MRSLAIAMLAGMTIGCTTVETTFSQNVSASDVSTINVDLERGHFSYVGTTTGTIQVDGRAYGYATNAERASDRQDDTMWDIGLSGSALNLLGRSDATFAGVDFDVLGPTTLNTSVYVANGSASVDNLYGNILINAESVDAHNIGGNVDIVSRFGDVHASIYPVRGETIRIEANGDVTVWLPWGLDYDLQVWGDPEHEMIIENLGFGWSTAAPGYYAAQAGHASTRVDIYANDGAVRVYVAW